MWKALCASGSCQTPGRILCPFIRFFSVLRPTETGRPQHQQRGARGGHPCPFLPPCGSLQSVSSSVKACPLFFLPLRVCHKQRPPAALLPDSPFCTSLSTGGDPWWACHDLKRPHVGAGQSWWPGAGCWQRRESGGLQPLCAPWPAGRARSPGHTGCCGVNKKTSLRSQAPGGMSHLAELQVSRNRRPEVSSWCRLTDGERCSFYGKRYLYQGPVPDLFPFPRLTRHPPSPSLESAVKWGL